MADTETYYVKVALTRGDIVKIALDFNKLSDEIILLLQARLVKGAFVCRGRYNLSSRSVMPRFSNGSPSILDVYEATCESLIESLERDEFEIRQMRRALSDHKWAVALCYGRPKHRRHKNR